MLAPQQRAALALAMLDDVVAVAIATRHSVLVVTDSRSIGARVRRLGARALIAPARGTRAAAARGLTLVERDGAAAALVLAADLPFVVAADLRRIIAAGQRADIVIVPASDRVGTNALLLRPPSRMAPLFGRASLEAHRRAAGAHGTVLRVARLGRDIDTPDDLRALRRSKARAGINTRRALAAIASGAAPWTRRGSPSPRGARSRTPLSQPR